MARPLRVSSDRILTAAASEFAKHGFAGARVDRIARQARVNKAMLYYHFGSKQAMYRTLLRQVFRDAAERLRVIAGGEGTPAQKLERLTAAMAAFVADHAFFPAIMLREVAEGGVHLDRDTLEALAAIPLAVAGVVQQGVASKALRPVHPIVAYFLMVAPIVMYLGGSRIRKELGTHRLIDTSSLPPAVFLEQLQLSIRLALTVRAS